MEASSLTPMSCSSRRMISPQAAALASTKACRPNCRFPAWWSICSSTAQSGRSNGSRFSAAMSTLTTQALDGSVSHVSLPSHGRNFSVNCGFSSTWAVLPRLRRPAHRAAALPMVSPSGRRCVRGRSCHCAAENLPLHEWSAVSSSVSSGMSSLERMSRMCAPWTMESSLLPLPSPACTAAGSCPARGAGSRPRTSAPRALLLKCSCGRAGVDGVVDDAVHADIDIGAH